jgi:hypothetical protein
MTTAATLEALNDRARFELLATSILRKAEPRYAGIIHTGINAEAETIVSPVDAAGRCCVVRASALPLLVRKAIPAPLSEALAVLRMRSGTTSRIAVPHAEDRKGFRRCREPSALQVGK